jgi:transcriptional regulator with XRE-family HTH domain
MATGSTARKLLGEALRVRREELGLTQETAASRCGLSTRYFRELEAGRPSLRLEIVARIVAGLEWSWSEIARCLSPPASRSVATQGDEGGAPREVHRLLDQGWKQSTVRERSLVERVLQTLAKSPSRG